MAFRTLTNRFSGLFTIRDRTGVPETPQLYLKLTTKCVKQADSMLGAATSPKFNHGQCKYLAHKLKVAVRSAQSFWDTNNTWYSKFATDADRAGCLEIFKLLLALSKEVETFIQDCSKDAWVQSAILLAHVAEHVTSLGFDLGFCAAVFSKRRTRLGESLVLTVAEVGSIRKAEGEVVIEKSNVDQLRLYEDVGALIGSSKSSGADREMARFVLERLKSSRVHPSFDSQESNRPSRSEMSLSSLKRLQELGKGNSGIVHKASWLGTEVARKTFHEPSSPDFEKEVKILEGLSHPNIVSLLWYVRDERNCYMVMQLMDGDLHSLMKERLEECGTGGPPFSMSEAIHMMLQVAEGMLFLRERRIVHRDLKSGNILVKQSKAREVVGGDYVQAKVADFGVARTKEKSTTYSSQTQNQGTTRWMAPEMIRIVNEDDRVELQGEEVFKHPFKVDVYSFGMVCFEILTGDVPFSTLTPKEVKKKVLDGCRPHLPEECPERLRCLIEGCWSSEPKERPEFGDICAELRQLKCALLMTCREVMVLSESGGELHRESQLQLDFIQLLYGCTPEVSYCKPTRESVWSKARRWFSLEEIKKMTHDFASGHRLAFGRSSRVYKGVVDDTGDVVAVKRFRKDVMANDCKMEMEVLHRLHHNNVVGYVGFCIEKGEEILVLEYMPGGSLEEWLSDDARKVKMTWPVRQKICLGVANGIHYLHSLRQPRIIHRNVEPSRILLDQNLEPKVAGFNLAYLIQDGLISTMCYPGRDPMGYVPPEYFSEGILTQKVDVFQFGLVLLQIVSGRTIFDIRLSRGDLSLRDWVSRLYNEGRSKELIDRTLNLQPAEEREALNVIKIALLCVQSLPEKRPDMGLVVAMLHGNLDAEISRLVLEHGNDQHLELGESSNSPRVSVESSTRLSSGG